jgi:hypothetical protein
MDGRTQVVKQAVHRAMAVVGPNPPAAQLLITLLLRRVRVLC